MDYAEFLSRFKLVFDHPNRSVESSDLLLSLKQGNRSVAEYSVEFWTRAADCGWNEDALRGVFRKGLSERIKDELAVREVPASLARYVELAIRLDNRLLERAAERRQDGSPEVRQRDWAWSSYPQSTQENRRLRSPPSDSVTGPTVEHPKEEPMQVDHAHLTSSERMRRIWDKACMYCGTQGHFISACPVRPKGRAHQ